MSLCEECTSYKVCTKCDTNGILRYDLAGCVTDCSLDDSTGLGTKKGSSIHTTPQLR